MRHLRTSDFASDFAICPVCNGESFLPVFAHDGRQTSYTTACPHCLGFGKVARANAVEQETAA